MGEQDPTPTVDEAAEAAESADRTQPISGGARFTIGEKAVVLDDFIDITTGDLANRPVAQSRPQPTPLPKAVIWNARRPITD